MKFSISSASAFGSDVDSLSMSRYRGHSDLSLQQYEQDAKSQPEFVVKVEKAQCAAARAPGRRFDIQSMLDDKEFTITPLAGFLTILGLAAGIGLGVFLAHVGVSDDTVDWVSLLGSLYLDGLKCFVIPMMFCKVISSVAELLTSDRLPRVAGKTGAWFVISAFLASATGTIFGAIFASTFPTSTDEILPEYLNKLAFKCESGKYLVRGADGKLHCTNSPSSPNDLLFKVKESREFFVRVAKDHDELNISEQIFAILTTAIPENILEGFVKGTDVTVILTAVFFAIACVRGHKNRRGMPNLLLLLNTQASIVLRMVVFVFLRFMPIAVVSIVAGSIAKQKSNTVKLKESIYLIAAMSSATVVYSVIVMGLVLFLTTRRNPFSYLRHILPAQAFALGSAMPTATLPMTIRCVDSTGEVSAAVSRFVIPLGAVCNDTGNALFMPLATVFLAVGNGMADQLTPSKYLLMFLLSTISSLGVAPGREANLVMVGSIWHAVFGVNIPPSIITLWGVDWLLARFRAFASITTDAILARIIAQQTDDPILVKNPAFVVEDSVVLSHPQQHSTGI